MSNEEKIKILKAMGKTYREIGERLGISKQRVEQIFHHDTYLAKRRHCEHQLAAKPYRNRKPCSYCGT